MNHHPGISVLDLVVCQFEFRVPELLSVSPALFAGCVYPAT